VNTSGQLPEPPDLIDVIGVPGPELSRYLIRKLALAQVVEQRSHSGSSEAA
jgi:hypothetical protein